MSSGDSESTNISWKEKGVDEKNVYIGSDSISKGSTDWYADGSLTPEDLEIIQAHLDDISHDEALEIVRKAVRKHKYDPGLPIPYLEHLKALAEPEPPIHLTEAEFEYHVKFEAFVISQWSIYPEVRAATRPIGEKDEPCETFRVYVIGIAWAGAGSCLDTFFANRFPDISMSGISLQILVALTGRLWASFPKPSERSRWRWLNPGPWGFKEQVLSSCAVTVAAKSPYVYYVITAQANKYFFDFDGFGYGYVILLLLSSTFMGFGVAGLLRVLLVYPEDAIWYQALPSIVLSRSLIRPEARQSVNHWRLTRIEIFWIVSWLSFGWYWITGFVFTGLQNFDWPVWCNPRNIDLAAICGNTSGLGLNPIPFLTTFDWNIADSHGMIMPWWSQANTIFGLVVAFSAIVGIWYTNVSFTGYLPINSNTLYTNTGKKFNVSKILNSDGSFSYDKYKSYSSPYFTAGALIGYGCNLALYPAAVTYAILYHGEHIWQSTKQLVRGFLRADAILAEQNDRFSRAMRKYKEVPEYWYLAVLIAAFVVSIGMVEGYKNTQTPVWSIVLSIGISLVLIVPFGYLYQATSYQIDPNEIMEVVMGALRPGDAQSNMITKAYATTLTNQAEAYLMSLKEAHYVGLPTRPLFRLQMIACAVSCFVQSGIITWQQFQGGVPDMCSTSNTSSRFTCGGARQYFNAGVNFGTIGTPRLFRHIYPGLKWSFLYGALLPLPIYVLRRWCFPRLSEKGKRGLRWTNGINELALLSGAKYWAPQSLQYTAPNAFLCWFFSYFVKRRFPRWHTQYVHIIWAAMGVGVAYSALIMFFATQYKHTAQISWWGNHVASRGLDADYEARRLPIPDIGYFGPAAPLP